MTFILSAAGLCVSAIVDAKVGQPSFLPVAAPESVEKLEREVLREPPVHVTGSGIAETSCAASGLSQMVRVSLFWSLRTARLCRRRGQWSIRINDQWRICFEWPEGSHGPAGVEIVDDH